MPKVKYVYLDQGYWIELRKRPEDDETRKAIEQAVKSGDVVLPLINTLLRETGKYGYKEEREEHFNFMYELSQSYGLREYTSIGDFEIDRFVAVMGGYNYDLIGQVRGKGIAHLYGEWSIEVDEDAEIDDETLKELEEEVDEELKSKRGFDISTKSEDIIDHYQNTEWEEKLVEKMNEILEEWDETFDDNQKRRRFSHYAHFYQNILPDLAQKLSLNGLKYDFSIYDIEKYIHEGDEMVDTLFRCFPSRYTYITLNNVRDLQKNRDAKPNDIYDMFSLAVAIPYSDTVVTENFWKAEAKRADLDEIYNTEILSSLDELSSIISG